MIMENRGHKFHRYKDRALDDLFTAPTLCLLNLSIVKQDSLTFSSNINAVVQTWFHHHEKLKQIVLTWLLHSSSVLGFFSEAIVSFLLVGFVFYFLRTMQYI
ncbi:hypothetical protein MUK42_33397 [Musa troglodytarum]|uniref:Uncharacterized protein n=1 Tax=Musa troglodytarum TaxID=320322 RepID=A0A9E7L382_9LILI|nr:hypothetical protein MUK42_33397 [Musa troglodytarum]